MNIYQKAIETFGKNHQLVVAMEEMSELQKEISKELRKKGNTLKLIEEIADVEVMIEQLKLIIKVDESTFEKIKNLKLIRLERIIQKTIEGDDEDGTGSSRNKESFKRSSSGSPERV